MKFLLALLLFTLPAHAIIIEDSADRLVFDLLWTGPSMFGISADLQGPNIGEGGSQINRFMPGANQFRYLFEVHRQINGIAQPVLSFQITFQGWDEDGGQHAPTPVWGTLTEPFISVIPRDHLLAVEGNVHAVRVVIGALPVSDTGSTAGLLLLGLFALGIWRPQRA